MTEPEKTTVLLQRNSQPFKLQLVRGQRGGYGWKIEVQTGSLEELLYEVDMIDTYLRGKYLNELTRTGTLQKQPPSASNNPHSRMEKAFEGAKRADGKGVFGVES